MKSDVIITCLTKVALGLEREINDNLLSDNLIAVRNRSRAAASLATVQAMLADDWLVVHLTRLLRQEQEQSQ